VAVAAAHPAHGAGVARRAADAVERQVPRVAARSGSAACDEGPVPVMAGGTAGLGAPDRGNHEAVAVGACVTGGGGAGPGVAPRGVFGHRGPGVVVGHLDGAVGVVRPATGPLDRTVVALVAGRPVERQVRLVAAGLRCAVLAERADAAVAGGTPGRGAPDRRRDGTGAVGTGVAGGRGAGAVTVPRGPTLIVRTEPHVHDAVDVAWCGVSARGGVQVAIGAVIVRGEMSRVAPRCQGGSGVAAAAAPRGGVAPVGGAVIAAGQGPAGGVLAGTVAVECRAAPHGARGGLAGEILEIGTGIGTDVYLDGSPRVPRTAGVPERLHLRDVIRVAFGADVDVVAVVGHVTCVGAGVGEGAVAGGAVRRVGGQKLRRAPLGGPCLEVAVYVGTGPQRIGGDRGLVEEAGPRHGAAVTRHRRRGVDVPVHLDRLGAVTGRVVDDRGAVALDAGNAGGSRMTLVISLDRARAGVPFSVGGVLGGHGVAVVAGEVVLLRRQRRSCSEGHHSEQHEGRCRSKIAISESAVA